MHAFNRAISFLERRTKSFFEVAFGEKPVETRAQRHPVDTLPELIGMQTRIRIRQYCRDCTDTNYGKVKRVQNAVVPHNDGADISFANITLNQRGCQALRTLD